MKKSISERAMKAAAKYGVKVSATDTEAQIWGRVNKARKAAAVQTAADIIAETQSKKAARDMAREAVAVLKEAKEKADAAYEEALLNKREAASDLAEARAVLTAVNKTKVAKEVSADKKEKARERMEKLIAKRQKELYALLGEEEGAKMLAKLREVEEAKFAKKFAA